MAPKRKNTQASEQPTGREKKKLKVAFARTIAVQVPTSNTPSTNAVAGPSTVASNSVKSLPSAIDVEKFTEARAFEIDAMEKAMKSASESSTHRAWQQLPRHMRRRAASHDVRRVPLRLRDKARAEMDPVKRKPPGRSVAKLGKEKRVTRSESFIRRQADKTWLETHIWHAKRMKMENMWGYRLAVHPTEKAFRPSHRASIHGSILHDASYYSLIELKGPDTALKMLLEMCCDLQGHAANRFSTGARVLETHIYQPQSYPFDLIAPVMVLWKPALVEKLGTGHEAMTQDIAIGDSATATKRTEGKGKEKKEGGRGGEEEKAPVPTFCPLDPSATRVIWIRSHPAVYDEVFGALQRAASLTLSVLRESSGGTAGNEYEIELADLRGQVNVFELMGPKSSQVIKGALSPVREDQRDDFKNFWSSLKDLQTSGSVPRGMVIGFKVYDPRLNFPPKNAKTRANKSVISSQVIAVFPNSSLAMSEIWDDAARSRLVKPRYKKKELDERRSKSLVPGERLNPFRQDDRIPVLLIQRSLESPAGDSEGEALHGWTLIIPCGWSMPFLPSLTYTGTRVGGQRERQTQSFEAGITYFPRDYPLTKAYVSYAKKLEEEERESWERKPPAKRPNYDKLGTRSPWIPDWNVVLGLSDAAVGKEDFVPAQREDSTTAHTTAGTIKPWLFRGSNVHAIFWKVASLFNPSAGLMAEINALRTKHRQNPLDSDINAEDLWSRALVPVKVVLCGRGAPTELAAIYSVDDDEARRWNNALWRKDKFSEDTQADSMESPDLSNSQLLIIGYVTTGNFSLSRGAGFAIGAVSLARLYELQQQAQRLHPDQNFLLTKGRTPPLIAKIRDRDGQKCRAAHLEILSG